jgi:hypothetical protein
LNIFQPIGRAFLRFLEAAGRLALFAIVSVSHCVRPPIYPRLIGRQMIEIGYYSLPVVGLTTLFSGMVLALQSYTGFARFSAESAVPNVVVLSMTRELGPVLAGLMVAGRIGAAMAAEIGTMRVTEQIGGGGRYYRRVRRLPDQRLQAGLQPGDLYQEHLAIPGVPRRLFRRRKGRRLRFHRRPDGLL